MRSSSFATKFWVIWSKKRVSHSLTKKMKRFSIKFFLFLKPIKMKNFCHPLLSYLERRIAGERNLAGFCVRCFTWSFLSIFSTILIQESYVKKEKKVELWSVGPRLAVRSRSLHRKDILVEKMWKKWFSNIFDRKKLRSSTGLELRRSEHNATMKTTWLHLQGPLRKSLFDEI